MFAFKFGIAKVLKPTILLVKCLIILNSRLYILGSEFNGFHVSYSPRKPHHSQLEKELFLV